MPSTHHFLATLFSKILLHSQDPPSSWRHANIITIHKKGDPLLPANFRPIALTSVIGKLFHKVLADRFEDYLVHNSMIDKSLQKGFLRGVNGCMEHVFAVQSIISNAQEHSLPFAMSFIDLRNAFGSVSHRYIKDIIHFVKLPPEFANYVNNLYSSLSAQISTKDWITESFPIQRGVFQGDTLSPLLFLIAFNPIIQSVKAHPSKGYALKLPDTAQSHPPSLPSVNSHIYALWDEQCSDETPGWYLAKVLCVHDSGLFQIRYRKGGLIEDVCLPNIKWTPAMGNGKWFLPCSSIPPSTTIPAVKASQSHKVKGYADDLTVISSTPDEHQEVVSLVDTRCNDINLTVRPDKCHTLVFDGKAPKNNTAILVGGRPTSNIKDKPSTFLGSVVACSRRSKFNSSNLQFSDDLTACLQRVDNAPLRGEYKVWIYRRYVIPSLHYDLAVNPLSSTTIKKMNSLATRYIKKWLGLSRSTTVAVIHHPSVLNIPTIESCSTKSKLSFLSAVTLSPDPLIKEISASALSRGFGHACGITDETRDILSLATSSIESISRKTLPRATRAVHLEHRREKWDSSLECLSVQRKFSDVCVLESDNHVWNRIMDGLPPGQLSFILRAASDTLPTPLNLRRWKYRTDPKCPLCGSLFPTVLHILNACPTALNQGRLTWRHDSVLLQLARGILPLLAEGDTLYADLPGRRVCDNPPTTIPQNITATSARPDLVIVRQNEVLLIELTVPFNSPESMNNARTRKENKQNYQLVLSELDRKGVKASLTTLEIGALGHTLTQTLSDLKRTIPGLSSRECRQIFDDAGKMAITCSHAIFNARNELTWSTNRPLLS